MKIPFLKNIAAKKTAWLKVLFIALVVLLFGLLLFLGIRQIKERNAGPRKIFSCLGEIIQIEAGKIVIAAKAEKNLGFGKDSNVVALVGEQTKFVKIEQPKIPPKDLRPGTSASIFVRQDISFSDLKTGDEIIAISNDNIKNKSQFEALKIEVLNN